MDWGTDLGGHNFVTGWIVLVLSEVFRRGAWERLTGQEDFAAELDPAGTDPIAEQVANISLPDAAG